MSTAMLSWKTLSPHPSKHVRALIPRIPVLRGGYCGRNSNNDDIDVTHAFVIHAVVNSEPRTIPDSGLKPARAFRLTQNPLQPTLNIVCRQHHSLFGISVVVQAVTD